MKRHFQLAKNLSLNSRVFFYAVLIFVLISCQEKPQIDEVTEKEKILAIHNQQRVTHFEKLLDGSFDQFSDQFISVNRGEIKSPSKTEFLAKRKNYFQSVEFEKWDDINPPVIRFSDDYSMAYTIVNKEVVVTFLDENGEKQRELTEFSWVAIYKKSESEWEIDCVVSTNKPSEVLEL